MQPDSGMPLMVGPRPIVCAALSESLPSHACRAPGASTLLLAAIEVPLLRVMLTMPDIGPA